MDDASTTQLAVITKIFKSIINLAGLCSGLELRRTAGGRVEATRAPEREWRGPSLPASMSAYFPSFVFEEKFLNGLSSLFG